MFYAMNVYFLFYFLNYVLFNWQLCIVLMMRETVFGFWVKLLFILKFVVIELSCQKMLLILLVLVFKLTVLGFRFT